MVFGVLKPGEYGRGVVCLNLLKARVKMWLLLNHILVKKENTDSYFFSETSQWSGIPNP